MIRLGDHRTPLPRRHRRLVIAMPDESAPSTTASVASGSPRPASRGATRPTANDAAMATAMKAAKELSWSPIPSPSHGTSEPAMVATAAATTTRTATTPTVCGSTPEPDCRDRSDETDGSRCGHEPDLPDRGRGRPSAARRATPDPRPGGKHAPANERRNEGAEQGRGRREEERPWRGRPPKRRQPMLRSCRTRAQRRSRAGHPISAR